MKPTQKILGLLFFITMIILSSCESTVPVEKPWPPQINPEDFYKLHHHIRPSKPIRIPDTMAILMKPVTFETQLDTTNTPQDSIPQENNK